MTTWQITFIFVIAFGINNVHGTDCSFGTSRNVLQQYMNSCPTLLEPSKDFCCFKVSDQSFYCCDAQEWALQTGLSIILPAIISVLVIVFVFVLCISCLCCSCCPWYKRRHRGTIYGTVQTRGVTHQVPGSNPPPSHVVHVYPPYTGNEPVQAAAYQCQPPPYTAEPYAKQAPYNPTYSQ